MRKRRKKQWVRRPSGLKHDEVSGSDNGKVGENVRDPGGCDCASARVEEAPKAPNHTNNKPKHNGERRGGEGKEDDDVVEREGQAGECDREIVLEKRAERAKEEPSPVKLLKERVKRGEEKTDDDEDGRCGNAECLRSWKSIRKGGREHVRE